MRLLVGLEFKEAMRMNESEVRKELDSIIKSLQQIDLSKKEKSSTTLLEDAARLTSLRNNITRSCL